MKIKLKPLGNVADEVLENLCSRVNCVFQCPTEILPGFNDITYAYDAQRKQYLSSKLVEYLKGLNKERDERIVGIVDVDIYAPGLNFVFGEAYMSSGIAVISLYRLRQEYYGLPSDNNLFLERATKEIVHELGHTFGLGHCHNAKCVMHFSNSLADTDRKETSFCSSCRPKFINLA